MKKGKIALAALLIAVLIGGGYTAKTFGVFCMGNYGLSDIQEIPGTALEGKTVLFLGSSVTRGFGSFGVSFVDYLAEIYGVHAVKEAVSGTTLADLSEKSYVSRLRGIDKSLKADAFVCQLSTNDATKNVPLGQVSGSFNKEDFNVSTVAGAVEYIIAYVRETWGCPAAFYTQTRYPSEAYAAMVSLLEQIREKWDITVIDLWNDTALNDITQAERTRWLADAIHPTKAGYLEWWLPKIQRELSEMLCG